MNKFALILSIGLLGCSGGGKGKGTGGGGTDTASSGVKKASVGNGIELEYAEMGNPSGKPVLLIHGVYDSRHAFDLLTPALASYHVYALDLRGHGNSTKPDTGYSQADFAGDVVAFMDVIKQPKMNLVGHSMGALIAHKIAVEHPERVDRLVLIDGAPTVAGKPAAVEAQGMLSQLKDPIDPGFVGEWVKSSYVKTPPEDFMKTAVAETSKIPAKVWNQVLAGVIAEDHAKALSSIKAKTLILWGDKDPLFDQNDQKILDESIPDSTLTVYAGAGHNVPSEEAAQAGKDIDAFLK